jgi:hypothetical protein
MYEILPPDVPVSQGDIIDDCPIFSLKNEAGPVEPDTEAVRWDMRVVVLTQACDVANAKTTQITVALVHKARDLVDQSVLKESLIRDRVRRSQVFGLYFLPMAPPPIDLPESIVDLRDLHTLPRAVLEHLIGANKRVCRIVTPWREHLSQHFGVTYSRIALPEPYETEP